MRRAELRAAHLVGSGDVVSAATGCTPSRGRQNRRFRPSRTRRGGRRRPRKPPSQRDFDARRPERRRGLVSIRKVRSIPIGRSCRERERSSSRAGRPSTRSGSCPAGSTKAPYAQRPRAEHRRRAGRSKLPGARQRAQLLAAEAAAAELNSDCSRSTTSSGARCRVQAGRRHQGLFPRQAE